MKTSDEEIELYGVMGEMVIAALHQQVDILMKDGWDKHQAVRLTMGANLGGVLAFAIKNTTTTREQLLTLINQLLDDMGMVK